MQDGTTFRDPTKFRGDGALGALRANAFVPHGGGPPEGHRCPGEALIQLVMPAFLGWFVRHHDLTFAPQDVTAGGGGLGPLPRSGLQISVKWR